MIKIDISGMTDGEYEIDLNVPISQTECAFEEFFGDVVLNVRVVKLGHRYNLKCHAECFAKMICDRSLKDFEEKIVSNFDLAFIADTKLFLESGKNNEDDNEIIIKEDYKYINIADEVVENLALQLPMKRVAPEYRDKDISEIFPELSSENIMKENAADERWSKLKNFKIN